MRSNEADNQWWPREQARQVQTALCTPARLKVILSVWQRDDDKDTVMCSVDAVDGDGQVLAMRRFSAPRTLEWDEALTRLRAEAAALFYDLNSPY